MIKKLICKIFGHKITNLREMSADLKEGLKFSKVCDRCGELLKGGRR